MVTPLSVLGDRGEAGWYSSSEIFTYWVLVFGSSGVFSFNLDALGDLRVLLVADSFLVVFLGVLGDLLFSMLYYISLDCLKAV